ncbi:Asp23/Gls24 family envelope stress response protein [Helcococcus kunzii]|uniref:Alkaline-shock protein n=1 Tax=Helcococcus kunzii ATCC 51366 TaxID=883114 RepID=H3NLV3_9FIRM|nr:Asp23/Gls24 family envelope stress response protein [Helcococcus kunzii]EHR35623.1 hypothetical protein HMPREF9709_00314 [Helcococcus kunzii ATCC 51366]MCT1796234.1 Asp23/Gls24 family envelope stress response protein [Helcococcus kunzii]MCT1988911.1 Asp23/Gls24 family envelope stress response protein [Helcococcus kunzii]QUY64236.1 Asp23/Gls24 family envelope stress response protein [Helcococcus kunzii]QZO76692.1 Asp23/Gls24 family envelope stress response protein [Helcococcus kunzii]
MTDFKNGSVKISNDIIDQLIAETALHVENVVSVVGYRNKKVEKNRKDSITSIIENNTIDISLAIEVEKNKDVYKIAENVQKAVQEQIKIMLGFEVKNVNVIVKSFN